MKVIAILAASVLLSLPLFQLKRSDALSGSDWQVGKIITDGVFFSPNTLSVAGIQSFLNAKVPDCDTNGTKEYQNTGLTRAEWADANNKPAPPYTCLKDYTQNISTRASDAYCASSVSGGTKSAAQIIYDVAKACSVSPRVLIVLLQKEQSLITDDWPWPVQYQKATGFGCPDTAPCDPDFAGFYNQVWYAARQYQRYAKQPQNYNYRGGQTSYLRYNPSSSCGGTNVYMQNQATAGLYNYTPYQPNSAALNNLYGTGNGCSAYGNRNFWRLYNDWFGNTLVNPPPDSYLIGDWNGDGHDTIGLKRGNLYLLDNDNDGRAEELYFYGRPEDTPFVGDFDGDGDDTIGVKIGNKYFINNELDETSELKFTYARSQDTPIVGDWDGDGDDTIGIRIGNKYFTNNDFDGISDLKFVYARATDTTIIGDFNGDAVDTISAKIGNAYYVNNGHDSQSEFKFYYARDVDIPFAGDFDKNGTDTIGVKLGVKYFYNNDFDSRSDSKIIFQD